MIQCCDTTLPAKSWDPTLSADEVLIDYDRRRILLKTELDVMDRDSKRMRGDRPYLFASIRAGQGVEEIASFIQCAGGLSA